MGTSYFSVGVVCSDADHGGDVQKGIKLYKQNHPEVIYTYDVTHAMALLLKHELVTDEKYQSFVQQCHRCRQQLQQTNRSARFHVAQKLPSASMIKCENP
ncbi:hypothetical protein LC609_08340 [Nostoc sp. XA013]|nr:hypothetical protein [Nostoc sp. XA013]